MTGMPSFAASLIARCSRLASTTQIAEGVFVRLRMPPSDLWSLSSSRFLRRSSFLVKPLSSRVLEVELFELLHAREALGDRLRSW